MTPPRVVLDSDVIFSRVLHELCGRAASDGMLFTVIWSDELLTETRSSLIEHKELREDAADKWVGYIADAFPAGRTNITEVPSDLDPSSLTKDPKDEHVCALAVAGQASVIVTSDKGFRKRALMSCGIRVKNPDRCLVDAFDGEDQLLVEILSVQAGSWGGGRSVDDLLDALSRAGAKRLVARARKVLSR